MTIKQLPDRLGVPLKDINIELNSLCRFCKKFGGNEDKSCEDCFLTTENSVMVYLSINKEQA